ncbi:MAG TPA: sodium:solute symporter [Vicinamibacterales bacterium]|nr:sodium:solute symporter [Vicinamibacterales bacterium]
MTLSTGDYLVIALYLVAITAFGSWFARFQKTTRDYFLADRSSPWWAICFTIVATETSTLSFIGVPAQTYTGAMGFLQLAFGYIVGRILVSLLFIPAYFRGELVTSYELLQRRFGAPVKTAASAIFLVTRSLADGIRLFATALVIAVVTGVPVTWTVVLLGSAMIVYTVRGGASAVIWTDVVQMFVYIGGAGLVFWALLDRIPGGWSEVVSSGTAAGKFVVLSFSTDPKATYTVWAGLVGGIALTLATHGTDQFLVQRLLSARSQKEASLGLVLSGFIVFAQFTLFLLIGVMLFTYYQHVPAPVLGRVDEILPSFVVNTLTGGVAGFIVAAIVAAALSPSINSMAAVTVSDFYVKFINPRATDAEQMRLARQSTIGWGIVQIAVGVAAQWMNRSVLDAGLSVLSLASGPVLGAFLVGVLTKRVQAAAMLTGMIAGAATLVFLWWNASVAWTWYAFIGAVVTAIVALAVSLATPNTHGDHQGT